VAAWLKARFGNSRMSGSGSAVFARLGSLEQSVPSGIEQADRIRGTGDQLLATGSGEEIPAGWVGRMCQSLDHHPLVGWAD